MPTKNPTTSEEAKSVASTNSPVSTEINKVSPLELIAIADAAVDLLQKALAALDNAKKNGAQITPEQQQALQTKYQSLKNQTDEQFSGEHWQLQPPPAVESPVKGTNT